jgi:pyruvate formate lyase activating enzyme
LSSYKLSPDEIVRQSISHGCKSISYTYTEPTIFFEYAYDTAKIAKEQKLHNNFVTNGYMTRQALDIIGPYLDAANVDLKSFREATYKEVCGGHLEPVCESIKYMKRLGIWVEITTLIVPGINDSQEEMRDIAAFISEVGIDIPWHISRFHPDYKYTDVKPTPIEALRTAYDTGKKAGLRYVYLGNVAEDTNTYCYNCGELLILRDYLFTLKSNLKGSSCPKCGSIIDGIFI